MIHVFRFQRMKEAFDDHIVPTIPTGVRGPEDYALEEVAEVSTSSTALESLIQRALEDRPEVISISNRIRQSEEQLSGAHPGQTNLWWGVGATLSVPLFTGFLIENRVAEARGQKYAAELKKVDLSNRVALEVTDSYVMLQTAQQQIKVEEKEVESARSSLTLAKERCRLGLASIVDVTTATAARCWQKLAIRRRGMPCRRGL